jgi:large subunit ribosomal protein L3
MIGLVGTKCGMTRVFDASGSSIPVTVLAVEPNRVVQVKNPEKDGYRAVQIAVGHKKVSRLNKPMIGHYAKYSVEAGDKLCEFRVNDDSGLVSGGEVGLDIFKVGDLVDVSGVSKGKGFAGVIKRYHFSSQDATHGNSLSHRAPGSIGQRQTPGRVFKGKKMAGHLGNVNRTIKNQKIVKIDVGRGLMLVQGGIAGAPNGKVIIKKSNKIVKKGE